MFYVQDHWDNYRSRNLNYALMVEAIHRPINFTIARGIGAVLPAGICIHAETRICDKNQALDFEEGKQQIGKMYWLGKTFNLRCPSCLEKRRRSDTKRQNAWGRKSLVRGYKRKGHRRLNTFGMDCGARRRPWIMERCTVHMIALGQYLVHLSISNPTSQSIRKCNLQACPKFVWLTRELGLSTTKPHTATEHNQRRTEFYSLHHTWDSALWEFCQSHGQNARACQQAIKIIWKLKRVETWLQVGLATPVIPTRFRIGSNDYTPPFLYADTRRHQRYLPLCYNPYPRKRGISTPQPTSSSCSATTNGRRGDSFHPTVIPTLSAWDRPRLR